jgi:hypothetical protein
MGTVVGALSKVLFGQSRRSILSLLYGHADEQFYLREIARRARTGIGATQRELGRLTDAGLIHRVRRGHQVYYHANRQNPIFAELKSILAKTSGIRDVLNEGLVPLAERIRVAFVYGSIARGDETGSSDVARRVDHRRTRCECSCQRRNSEAGPSKLLTTIAHVSY